jgi:hypothetical protein
MDPLRMSEPPKPPPAVARPLPGLVPAHVRNQAANLTPAPSSEPQTPEQTAAAAASIPKRIARTVTAPAQGALDGLLVYARGLTSTVPELVPLLAGGKIGRMVPAVCAVLVAELARKPPRLSDAGRVELERVLAPFVRRGVNLG